MAFPDTKETLEAAGYVFDNDGVCRGPSCGARVEWWITPDGKRMPMSVQEIKIGEGYFAKAIGFKRIPHWADCPDAKRF
jgi:hypothetical protein